MSVSYKLEDCLPEFLKNDIRAWEEGLLTKSTFLDCLFCEVQSSINIAYYNSDITEEEADFLRIKYLGIVE